MRPCRRRPSRRGRRPSPSPSTACGIPLSRPRVTVRDDTRRSRRERPSPLPAPMPGPPPSAPPDRPRSGCPGPSFLLSSVSPPRGPARESTTPTTCDSTACRGYPSASPRTARSSRHRPRPLLRSLLPSTTHSTPAFSGCRATCPATSAHSSDSFLTVDHTHQPGRPHPLAPPPLRYAGTSQLLRVSPPARPATVLGSLRIPPLGVLPLATNCSVTVSRRAFTCSVREPGPDSCCLYAGHHLGSRRVTPRLLPEQRPDPGFDVI